MDEHIFQNELRQLKQRVSQMSLSSQQRQREHLEQLRTSYTPDSFSSQLHSIKAQLESMQSALAAQVQQHDVWRQAGPEASRANITLPPHGGFDEHVTPIYWKFYSPLKADVQWIDERVANLENLYSELEDRIDALDPRRFTPPGSENGVDEAGLPTVHHAQAAVPLEKRTESELPGDLRAVLHDAPSEAAVVNVACHPTSSSTLDEIAKDVPTETSVGDGLAEAVPAQPSAGVAFRDKEIDRLEELLKRSHDINRINDTTLEFREQEVSQLEARARGAEASAHQMVDTARMQASELDRQNETIRRLSAELRDFKASRHHFMTKYVDENYRYKWLKQKKIQSEDQLQRRIDELEQALTDVEDGKIAAHHAELEKLQAFCSQKDAVIYRQEEIIARGGKIIQQRDADISHREGCLDEMDKERIHLRDEVARLVSKLRQRDATIKQMRHEIEDAEVRIQDLEDSRQKDTERLKRASRLMRENAHADETAQDVKAEPFDQAAKAASNRQNANPSTWWTPRPIQGYAKLPHEENRALVWGQRAPAPARHSFGSSSPINMAARQQQHRAPYRGARRSMPAMRSANDSDQRSRVNEDESGKSDTLDGADAGSGNGDSSFTRRAAESAEKSRMNAQKAAGDHPGRHSLPLDATFWPPLPAPVPAGRRVESVPNLRGAEVQTSNRQAAIAKPASMEQLPRRRLQAYVEEDEGGDERGDSSLLD